MSTLRARVEALESTLPVAVTLTFANGKTFGHRGPALRFFMDALSEVAARKGSLLAALRKTEQAKGCGRLTEVLLALDGEKRAVKLTAARPEGRARSGVRGAGALKGANR